MAKYEENEGQVLIAKDFEFDDDSAKFLDSAESVLFSPNSDFMNLIRIAFWDNQPQSFQSVHSTLQGLNPSNGFMNNYLRVLKYKLKFLNY